MKKVHVICQMGAELHALFDVPDKLSEKETLEYIKEHAGDIKFGDPTYDFEDASYDYYYLTKLR